MALAGALSGTSTVDDLGVRPWSRIEPPRTNVAAPKFSDVEFSEERATKTSAAEKLPSAGQQESLLRIAAVSKLKDGWADEGSRAPSAEALRDVILFIGQVFCAVPDAPAPRITAATDGEIVIEWFVPGKDIIVSVTGDGVFGYALFEGGRYVPGEDRNVGLELPNKLVDRLKELPRHP